MRASGRPSAYLRKRCSAGLLDAMQLARKQVSARLWGGVFGVQMGPILLQIGLQMAPRRALGASWASKGISDRFGVPFWLPFWLPFWAQLGQEPFPTSIFQVLRPPRPLQEALQRLSEGLRDEDSIWNQFGIRFWSQNDTPGPKKIIEIH